MFKIEKIEEYYVKFMEMYYYIQNIYFNLLKDFDWYKNVEDFFIKHDKKIFIGILTVRYFSFISLTVF